MSGPIEFKIKETLKEIDIKALITEKLNVKIDTIIESRDIGSLIDSVIDEQINKAVLNRLK